MASQSLWLWLATRKHIGARMANRLLAHFGTMEQVYATDETALLAVDGLTRAGVQSLCDKSLATGDAILDACQQKGIAILVQTDALYPDALRHLEDAPIVLYVRGTLPDVERHVGISIVGTRKASAYGLSCAKTFASHLAQAGCVIISGMARGIDGWANRSALLAGGHTIAVLGCGVDVCYPPEHHALMEDIVLSGALVSEYPPGAAPDRHHFPARNRLISALARGVLLIEAGRDSGALITVDHALEQGKDVFAVPGLIDMESFQGANNLIASGLARLAQHPSAIVQEYAPYLPQPNTGALANRILKRQTGQSIQIDPPKEIPAAKPAPLPPVRTLSEEEEAIVQAVSIGAGTLDEIATDSGLSIQKLGILLTMLELDGILTREKGRIILAHPH